MELCVAEADADLVTAPRPGSPDVVAELIEREGDRLYRLALRITGVGEDAVEIIEEALRASADRISALPDQSAYGACIYRLVARAAHESRKRRQLVDAAVLDDVVPTLNADGHFEPMVDWSTRVEEPVVRERLQAAFSEAIDELPTDYRTALILHDVEGASKAEIAEILTVDVQVVSSRVHRARLFVRKRLSGHFEGPGFAPRTA